MFRLDEKTKRRIIDLKFPIDGGPSLSAPDILSQLYKENDAGGTWVIVSERAIQKFIRKVKERRTKSMEFDEQPWTLLRHQVAQLRHQVAHMPDDPIVFELLKIWYLQQKQATPEHLPKPFPIGVARWAVTIHRMAPPGLRKERLLTLAKQYFTLQRMAELIDETVDSDLDLLVMSTDCQIAMHGEIAREGEQFHDMVFGLASRDPQELEKEAAEAGKLISLITKQITEGIRKQRTNKGGTP